MSAANAPSAGEYIGHHLKHLQNKEMSGVIDFSVFNIDSIFWGILLGVVGSLLLWKAASKATSGVPGRFQAAVEILFEISRLVHHTGPVCLCFAHLYLLQHQNQGPWRLVS